MSEAVASTRELYDRDDTFCTGIAAWVAERRCDLRLVDVLLEHGLTAQAEGARWAATEPDRSFASDRNLKEVCGPFPCVYDGNFYWYDCKGELVPRDSHDIPREYFGRQVDYSTDKFKNATDAILFLLDNWQPGAVEEPKTAKKPAPHKRCKSVKKFAPRKRRKGK